MPENSSKLHRSVSDRTQSKLTIREAKCTKLFSYTVEKYRKKKLHKFQTCSRERESNLDPHIHRFDRTFTCNSVSCLWSTDSLDFGASAKFEAVAFSILILKFAVGSGFSLQGMKL